MLDTSRHVSIEEINLGMCSLHWTLKNIFLVTNREHQSKSHTSIRDWRCRKGPVGAFANNPGSKDREVWFLDDWAERFADEGGHPRLLVYEHPRDLVRHEMYQMQQSQLLPQIP